MFKQPPAKIPTWTWEEIDRVAAKQDAAIKAAAVSPENRYQLTESEVAIICKSDRPRNSGGVYWIGVEHEACWAEMRDLSIGELKAQFIRQINNERLISELIGNK